MRPTLSVPVILVLALGSFACDRSGAELARTGELLQKMTNERDQLKTKLDRAEARVSDLQQQLEGLRSAAAAASTAKANAAAAKSAKAPPKAGSRSRPVTPAARR